MNQSLIVRDFKNPNYINNSLEIVSRYEFITINSNNFSEMRFFGEIYGMVKNGMAISKEETIEELSKASNLNEIIEIVRFIVGASYIYYKEEDKINIISSGAALSLYFYKYENKIYFTEFEHEICSYAIKYEKLNPYEIFDIFNTHRFDTVPYAALFNNIIRVPDGHVIGINKELNITYESYLNIPTNSSPKANYKNYKEVLEATAKLYVNSGKEIYVLFSAGIDSSNILLALKKNSDKIFPVATTQDFEGSYLGETIRERLEIFKDEFNIISELLHANRYSPNQRKIRDEICKLSSANCARWDSFVTYCVMEAYKDRKNCIFLTGQEMDDGYGIAFTKYHRNKAIRRKFMIGRYYYSKFYQNHLNFIIHKKLRNLRVDRDPSVKNPQVEYLTSMMHMREYQNDYIPVQKKISYIPDDFKRQYETYKKNYFLKCAFKNTDEIIKLPKKDINKKIRILRHYFSTPNITKDNEMMFAYQNPHIINLPVEGPLVDFFCNLQLGWKDILKGKRFLYKYFKEETGKDYLKSFSPENLSQYSKNALAEIKGDRLWVKRVNLDNFLFAEVYREDYRKNVNLHDPRVLKYIDHKYIKKYVKQLYDDAIQGLLKYNDLQNIYNLELFLKNVEEISQRL